MCSGLALTDVEALQRTRRFLAEFGVSTHEYRFSAGVGQAEATERTGTAMGASNVAAIREVIACSMRSVRRMVKGFLAGIFDAEGVL